MSARAVCGLLLALLAVLVAAPAALLVADPTLAKWGEAIHAAPLVWAHSFYAGTTARHLAEMVAPFVLPGVICGLLVAAGFLVPRQGLPPQRHAGLLALGLGVLLLLEPPLHLALLWLIAWHAPPGSGDLLLPRSLSGGRTLGTVHLAAISLLVPIAEEFFFRGRLLPWLLARLDKLSAVSLTALAFACAHGDPLQALVALPLGLLLGAVRAEGGSLLACIVIHQAHNALFVAGGPTVVAAPWAGLVLAMAGLACLGLGWAWPAAPHGPPRDPRRAVVVALAIAIFVLATYPLYQRAQDRLWVSATHRALAFGRLSDDILLERVDRLCLQGRVPAPRREALAARLRETPSPSGDRQVWLLARLDPPNFAAPDDDEAYDDFARLGTCPHTLPEHAAAARVLALAHPYAFARFAVDTPEVVARWMPLPAQADAALAQLRSTSGPLRQRLLAGLERASPGQIAAVLLRLPPTEVTPIDRRFLFTRYADARMRLDALAQTDPDRAAAFSQPVTVDETP
jgi:membrane protease YdiL (CAAX protease family)